MSKQSVLHRALGAALVIAVGFALVMMVQPRQSTAALSSDGGAHMFVPTTVAIQSRDEAPAPTF
ncbi:MAG TPA: hypothetical protein VM051_10000 [Usitatibacter sp.]|nr:hypothetical protein [Usitatibacter sp.]